ncbi:NAD-dependent epimerase/dehydratase family protein [Tropicimonas sp. TH_r6]|uniref:NAD-dependent epimerase/dehydratase family protein n=1 Tax=Tropicimonas sp. TH_r6 TaxID=3082085 RepID=UPI002952EA0F|nr:NAD-dependent epimerase/dehydratase family protein [Tropicimonas sp. TH_r6]MDV7142069.1 NAD-dependent epimerase/dehydratase family protein [Tropicimonas sp. TH_r6]
MKILILGGSGFIGSHVVDRLLATGHDVRVFDRSRERFRPTPAGVEFVAGELSDSASLIEALAGIDMVFHMVSTTVPGTANMDPIADIRDNLIGSVRMLELMRAQAVTRLLYLSSGGTVYGIPGRNPVPETHPIAPISSYGIVKAAVENYIRMEIDLHGLRAVVLRPSNPYGPRQGHGGVQGVIGTYMHQLAHGETLNLWGDGSVVRDFIHVHDLARLCVTSAEQDITGTFNAGAGEGHSLREIIDGIATVSGRPVEPVIRPGRAIDIPRIVLDTSAARDAFGWQPAVAFKDGLRDTWKWVLQQQDKAS